MDQKRIFELALETLEKQRTEIERAISEIREFQNGKKRMVARKPEMPTVVVVKRRLKTLAKRKAQAKKMREYRAAKKLKAAKPSLPSKTSPASAKARTKTDAEKKALSLKMKEIWKKRKAEGAKKNH